MIFGLSGHGHDPENQVFLTVDLQNYTKQFNKHTKSFSESIIWGNHETKKIETFTTCVFLL